MTIELNTTSYGRERARVHQTDPLQILTMQLKTEIQQT